MDNRRQHYRHQFPASNRLRVVLAPSAGGSQCVGEIVNLSVGGACVKFNEATVLKDDKCLISIDLEGANQSIELRAERVHALRDGEPLVGMRFLFPIHASARDHLERAISKYLFDVQREERQRLKEAQKRSGVEGTQSGTLPE